MISIIIPLYNKEHYILDTINSVFCQTNKDWECVIVDDGSTDRGPELVKNIHDSRIKYLKKKNGGVSSARNFGVSKAMGEWILYLDADDTLKSNCIKDFYIAIDNYPDSDLISANFTISDGQHNQKVGSRCEGYVSNPCSELFFDRLYLRPGAFIIKKDLPLEYKYNEGLSRYEDLEIQLRYVARLKICHISSFVMRYVQEATELSQHYGNPERDYLCHLKLDKHKIWDSLIKFKCMYIALRNYSPIKNKYSRKYLRWILFIILTRMFYECKFCFSKCI